MKNRILVLLLAVVCLFSFASCKKDTAASLYTGAMTSMEELNAMDAKITIKMSAKIGGETETEDIEMKIKSNGNNMYMESEDSKITYVDGVLYMDLGDDMKYKTEVSAEDFNKQYGSMANSDFPELTEEKLKDVELTEDGDNRSFTVTLDAATVKSFVDSMLGSMMGEDDSLELDISDITMTATFDKDDNLTKLNMKMKVAYELDGLDEPIEMDMDMTYDFTVITAAPAITAPADAADYEDQDLF